MKVVIIEDERITAEDLLLTLQQADPDLEVMAVIHSVAEGLAYFSKAPAPDLIFSDIRLGDGLSFELFRDMHIPVVFCTAYDEYALTAFKANGIDYILKPFTLDSVAGALGKYRSLARIGDQEIKRQYESIRHLFSGYAQPAKASALLIRYKDKIVPVKLESVALFHLDHTTVHLITLEGNTFYPGQTLDELERMAGSDFFRVNRQYLVNRKAIVHVASLLSRKLSLSVSVKLEESVLISKEKAPVFLKWLSGVS